MDRLATELLLEIFELVCTDDPVIARSLSSVSRAIHEASRPFRFRAISLHATTANLRRLIHRIGDERKRSPGILPRCRHLFLECPDLEEEMHTSLTFEDSLACLTLGGRSSSAFSYSNSGWTGDTEEEWSVHLSSLLCAIAPDLETFTLIIRSDLHEPIALPCPFPALRELTVVACGLPLNFDSSPISHHTCFPSLRRLHLVSLGKSETPADLVNLARHAPKLSHLRISHLPRQHNLAAFMRLYREDRPDTPFPALERVLIQPIPPPQRCGPTMLYCDFVTRLWCSTQRARVPVYLIPGDVKLQGADYRAFAWKAKEDWRDRIAGREGCWAVEEHWVNRSEVGHVVPWHLLIMGQR